MIKNVSFLHIFTIEIFQKQIKKYKKFETKMLTSYISLATLKFMLCYFSCLCEIKRLLFPKKLYIFSNK